MKRILEIGCGQGFNTYILSKKENGKVIGIDLSSDDINIAKKRYPKVSFKVMSAQDLKFKSKSFDMVYAMEVLEHVDDIGKTLDEVSRVLDSSGKFVVSIPFYKSEKWLAKLRPTYFKEIHHVRVFKEEELENLCKKRKLTLKKKKRVGFLQHIELFFLFKRKIKSKTQLSIGSWRDNIYTKMLHACMLYFSPISLQTPLRLFPIWIITIPAGYILDKLGSRVFPKSLYYEFEKK